MRLDSSAVNEMEHLLSVIFTVAAFAAGTHMPTASEVDTTVATVRVDSFFIVDLLFGDNTGAVKGCSVDVAFNYYIA